ncbi:pyridoxamine 5-phosphate oxidase [Mycolicibacterium sp. 018/SC-01/001]|uniref:pyridoxamine 5'-phosphate oxidase family protein n=1 Tax=Mycolicibacterium sp. 018/SC-01/001 TaxID=2592069 RepID=UPI00118154B8|nr:pyridoxamine 5'-phosphate oxidase family protein [Mycolicibacterium sp. 018/SC-01/001]TRW78426.1 pyridoxamine 5-phosphate oxidase [Mycolicibacterium sp. 018/SC-01/001]
MSKHYGSIAFTPAVRSVQDEHGSATFYGRKAEAGAAPGQDRLTDDERDYLAERDHFYLASVGETGWPYVQYRGGPAGFVRVLDDHTIGWADFRGNLQYISTGNIGGEQRVALIFLDYAHRRRLKVFGHARIVTTADAPELVASMADPTYDAVVERAVVVDIAAYDWNCPQHITPRYTLAELDGALEPMRRRLAALEAENAELRAGHS